MKKYATKYGWNLFYFDAFAGSGSREEISEEIKVKEPTLFDNNEIEEITAQTSY